VHWQAKIASIILLISLPHSVSAEDNDFTALNDAIHAYTEAKALGHKADTFLHARQAYYLSRKLYADAPKKLSPVVFSYANAAASYKEPIALELFQETLNKFGQAHGTKDKRLALPLINAADEAIFRKEPDMAYAWLTRAREILSS